jgi:hypothetical protein
MFLGLWNGDSFLHPKNILDVAIQTGASGSILLQRSLATMGMASGMGEKLGGSR